MAIILNMKVINQAKYYILDLEGMSANQPHTQTVWVSCKTRLCTFSGLKANRKA